MPCYCTLVFCWLFSQTCEVHLSVFMFLNVSARFFVVSRQIRNTLNCSISCGAAVGSARISAECWRLANNKCAAVAAVACLLPAGSCQLPVACCLLPFWPAISHATNLWVHVGRGMASDKRHVVDVSEQIYGRTNKRDDRPNSRLCWDCRTEGEPTAVGCQRYRRRSLLVYACHCLHVNPNGLHP